MNKKYALFIVLLLFFMIKTAYSQISLDLEMSKQTYFVGESWKLDLSVKNLSDSSIRLLSPQLLPYGVIEVIIRDTLGQYILPYRMNNLYVLSNKAHLNPDEPLWKSKPYPNIVAIAASQTYYRQTVLDFAVLDTTKTGLSRPVLSQYLVLNEQEFAEYQQLKFQEKTLLLNKYQKIATLPKGKYKISVIYKYPLDKDWFAMFFDQTYFKYLTQCSLISNQEKVVVK